MIKKIIPPMMVTASMAVASFVIADAFVTIKNLEASTHRHSVLISSLEGECTNLKQDIKDDIKEIKEMQNKMLGILLDENRK